MLQEMFILIIQAFLTTHFAKSLNLLLLSYKEYNYKFGFDIQPAAYNSSIFFNLDEDAMTLKYKWIKNKMANSYFKQQTDTTKSVLAKALPIKMFTNENGLSTVAGLQIIQPVQKFRRPTRGLWFMSSYLGNFCITQFD